MPRYYVSLVSRFDSDYTVEANNKEEAIEKAKLIFDNQSWPERVCHIGDGSWLNEYAEQLTENDHA